MLAYTHTHTHDYGYWIFKDIHKFVELGKNYNFKFIILLQLVKLIVEHYETSI